MSGCEQRLTVRVDYGVLDRTLCRCRIEGTNFRIPYSLFEDRPGFGLRAR